MKYVFGFTFGIHLTHNHHCRRRFYSAKNPLTSQMYNTQAIIKDVEKKIDCFSPELAITGRLSLFSLSGLALYWLPMI